MTAPNLSCAFNVRTQKRPLVFSRTFQLKRNLFEQLQVKAFITIHSKTGGMPASGNCIWKAVQGEEEETQVYDTRI